MWSSTTAHVSSNAGTVRCSSNFLFNAFVGRLYTLTTFRMTRTRSSPTTSYSVVLTSWMSSLWSMIYTVFITLAATLDVLLPILGSSGHQYFSSFGVCRWTSFRMQSFAGPVIRTFSWVNFILGKRSRHPSGHQSSFSRGLHWWDLYFWITATEIIKYSACLLYLAGVFYTGLELSLDSHTRWINWVFPPRSTVSLFPPS